MDKLKKWFNKPKKDVENCGVQPLTSERSHDLYDDVNLREILQEGFEQKQEVFNDQTFFRPLQMKTPQYSAAPPVCSSQVQVNNRTGERVKVEQTSDTFSSGPSVIRLTNTAPTSPGCFKPSWITDTCSLPSSPHPGGRRLPCSLPCSPLLRGRHLRSSSSSSSSSSSLSRLWVEEALQRSKNLRQNEPRPKMRAEGEGEEDRCQGGGEEGHRQVEAESAVTFKPMTSSSLRVQEEEDEDSLNLCLNLQTYCELTPCVCDRCPSAPPFEAELVSGLHMFPPLSFKDLGQTLTQSSQRTNIQEPEGDREQSLPTDRASQLGKSLCLYPSLPRISPGLQNIKQEQEVDFIDSHMNFQPNKTCYHGNTDKKLTWLSGELQHFCCEDLRLIPQILFDCSTCVRRTVFSVKRCGFCSDKLRNTKQLCTNCNQVHTHLCPD